MMKRIKDRYPQLSVHDVVSRPHPPLLPVWHFLRFHAVGAVQYFQAPHHLQVGFQREVLPTQVNEVLPRRADAVQVSHAVDIRLHSWPGGVDHVDGPADHEDVRETGSDGHDGFQEGSLHLLVHVDAVKVLGRIDCAQQVFKVLDLYTFF